MKQEQSKKQAKIFEITPYRLRRRFVLTVWALVCALGMALMASVRAAETATQADAAVDLVGVNTHLIYFGTVYDTDYDSIIKPRLIQSGIRHIRDSISTDLRAHDRYTDLANNGITCLLINSDTNPSDTQNLVKALNTNQALVCDSVESPNESDCNRSDWVSYLAGFLPAMWNNYKSDPATANVTVLGPSFCSTHDSASRLVSAFPSASNYMNMGNMHSYSGGNAVEGAGGGGGGLTLDQDIAACQQLSGGKPLVCSETGYHMSGDIPGNYSVSQRAAAKYIPRLFLSYLQKGVVRTYLYQLINSGEDYGILNDDGSPRQQFIAIQNYISLLKDPGANFSPSSLNYSLSGNTTNVLHSLLQKRDGRFYLILWQGVSSYDGNSHTDIEPPAVPITVTFNQPISSVKQYSPTFSGVSPIAGWNNPSSVSINVPDHIQVLEITPGSVSLPDLIVTSIGWSPANPTVGTPITFNATIKNQGNAATPNGVIHGISFSVDGSVVGWSDNNTTSLAPGASRIQSADGGPHGSRWTVTAGTHTILASVDDANRIAESNENNNTLTATLTPNTTTSSSGLSIDCGGGAVSPYIADTYFVGGNTASTAATENLTGVVNPAPAVVYQSCRWGPSTYTIGGLTAGAAYTVRLHFSEQTWASPGQRKFNVALNGTAVLTNFDIVATAGAMNKAVVQQFTATANNSGQVVIAFTDGSVDHPCISGIEVY